MSSTYQLKRSALFLSLVLLSSQYVLAGDNLTDLNIQTLDATENSKQTIQLSKVPQNNNSPQLLSQQTKIKLYRQGKLVKPVKSVCWGISRI